MPRLFFIIFLPFAVYLSFFSAYNFLNTSLLFFFSSSFHILFTLSCVKTCARASQNPSLSGAFALVRFEAAIFSHCRFERRSIHSLLNEIPLQEIWRIEDCGGERDGGTQLDRGDTDFESTQKLARKSRRERDALEQF